MNGIDSPGTTGPARRSGRRSRSLARATMACLCVSCAPLAASQQVTESVTLPQEVGPAGDEVRVQVPVGLDAETSQGADLTDSLSSAAPAAGAEAAPAAGHGEWAIVPIPFKSPLLGAGLRVMALRLYIPASRPQQERASMFGFGGMYAEGGSWAAAAADKRYWGQQSALRSTVLGGAGHVGYPVQLQTGLGDLTLPVEQDFQGGVFKLGYEVRDKLWLNAGLKFATTEVRVKGLDGDLAGGLPGFEAKASVDMALLTLSADWDSRSDQFYPRAGSLASLEIDHSDSALGADYDYTVYELAYNGYQAFGEAHTLAWRLAGKTIGGDAPFFSLAWYGSGVDLRGYTPGRYIGKRYAAAQAEWRWQATQRFGMVAFGGVGGVWGDVPGFEQDNFLPAGGLGLRWRLTDKFRFNFRIDYAWGRDDEVLLISAGEAF
jgi:hypothetical protein